MVLKRTISLQLLIIDKCRSRTGNVVDANDFRFSVLPELASALKSAIVFRGQPVPSVNTPYRTLRQKVSLVWRLSRHELHRPWLAVSRHPPLRWRSIGR